MPEQPNFLIIVADQLRADAVGVFGNRYVRTPSLDRLAAGGTCFTNAYVQHPVCSPSRASFLTGWYPHTAGHRGLRSLIRAGEPNLLRILRDAGYHVTWLGARGDTFAPGVTELSVHEYGFSEPPGEQPSRQDPDHDLWDRLYYRGRRAPSVIDHDEAAIRSGEKWLRSPPRDPWVLFVPLFGARVASGKFWSDITDQRLCAFGGRGLIAGTTVRTVLPVRGGGDCGGGADVLRGAAGPAACEIRRVAGSALQPEAGRFAVTDQPAQTRTPATALYNLRVTATAATGSATPGTRAAARTEPGRSGM